LPAAQRRARRWCSRISGWVWRCSRWRCGGSRTAGAAARLRSRRCATAWTDEKTLYLPFTDIALPALLAPNEALAHSLEDLHKTIGKVFYFVIGFHVLAALYHHFVRRDDTLRRMA
jgi:hypothetical protein